MSVFANVYYIKDTNPNNIYEMYELLHRKFKSPAIKVHTGERGNKNFLTPDYLEAFISKIDNPTIVECNTAYKGSRYTTEDHEKLLKDHGWDRWPCDIMDSGGILDLKIDKGKILKRNIVGKTLSNYKTCIVISHVKGHPMGGFGGALKQLSIGFASSKGKVLIHGHGNYEIGEESLSNVKSDNQDAFIDSMADAALSIVDYFGFGNIAYINILKNLSVSCDCDANAPRPCMQDLGILASLDSVAIDQASLDLIEQAKDKGKNKILNRIKEKHGDRILESAERLGIGQRDYKLITVE